MVPRISSLRQGSTAELEDDLLGDGQMSGSDEQVDVAPGSELGSAPEQSPRDPAVGEGGEDPVEERADLAVLRGQRTAPLVARQLPRCR